MSVPQGMRGENKFEVFIASRALAAYTIKVTSNPNVFKQEYGATLWQEIGKVGTEIFMEAWEANNIRVAPDGSGWAQRADLQRSAAAKCNELLALIQLAHKVYHLKSTRVKYWAEKTIYVRELIRKWHDGDGRRYSKV